MDQMERRLSTRGRFVRIRRAVLVNVRTKAIRAPSGENAGELS
jgi:hypothetical protein